MDSIFSYVHSLHRASSVTPISYNRRPLYHPWITTAVQSLSRVYKLRPIWHPYITSPGFSSQSFTTQSPVFAQNSPGIAQNCPNSSNFWRPIVQPSKSRLYKFPGETIIIKSKPSLSLPEGEISKFSSTMVETYAFKVNHSTAFKNLQFWKFSSFCFWKIRDMLPSFYELWITTHWAIRV